MALKKGKIYLAIVLGCIGFICGFIFGFFLVLTNPSGNTTADIRLVEKKLNDIKLAEDTVKKTQVSPYASMLDNLYADDYNSFNSPPILNTEEMPEAVKQLIYEGLD